MPQIITFSKVMVMYFYAMKMIKFDATCICDHLFKKTTFVLYLHLIAAIFPTSQNQFLLKTEMD